MSSLWTTPLGLLARELSTPRPMAVGIFMSSLWTTRSLVSLLLQPGSYLLHILIFYSEPFSDYRSGCQLYRLAGEVETAEQDPSLWIRLVEAGCYEYAFTSALNYSLELSSFPGNPPGYGGLLTGWKFHLLIHLYPIHEGVSFSVCTDQLFPLELQSPLSKVEGTIIFYKKRHAQDYVFVRLTYDESFLIAVVSDFKFGLYHPVEP